MRDSRPFVNDHRRARYQSMYGEQRGGQYRAMCADGIVRTATATGEADSFFTIPARVTVRGITVTGHIYQRSTYDRNGDPSPLFAFAAYTYLKNHGAIIALEDDPR